MAEAVIEPNQSLKREKAFDRRVHEIDFVRGICILLVVFDHLMFCFMEYENNAFCQMYWDSTFRRVFREFVLFAFCFCSGVSCGFSRNNWRRACELIGVAAAVLVVMGIVNAMGTFGFTRIDFNVIGVLGFSTLIYAFFEKKSWKSVLAMMLILLLCWCYVIPILYNEFYNGSMSSLPYIPFFWQNRSYADYMPMFPYCVWFFVGAVFMRFFYKEKKSLFKHKWNWERPICFVGRHTIWIYLIHQVVFVPFFMIF
ncbi:MAG: DUF1624 domain-containing protein [Coprobacillus sp.]|nr:DUF1624 domain-containing protein [Coprobacillus sp.]